MHQVLSRWISRDPSHSGFASFSCSPSSLEVPQKFSCVSSCCCTYGHPQTLVITHEQHDETAYNGWYYHRALQFTINDNSYSPVSIMFGSCFLMFMNQTCWTQHRRSHLSNIIPVISWVWLRLRHNPTYFWWLSLMWENIGPVWIAWDGNPTNWSTDWLPPKDKFQTFFFTGNIFLFI